MHLTATERIHARMMILSGSTGGRPLHSSEVCALTCAIAASLYQLPWTLDLVNQARELVQHDEECQF
jgi:hypothetical protein